MPQDNIDYQVLGGMILIFSAPALCVLEFFRTWEKVENEPLSFFREFLVEIPLGKSALVILLFAGGVLGSWIAWLPFYQSFALLASLWVISKIAAHIVSVIWSIVFLGIIMGAMITNSIDEE